MFATFLNVKFKTLLNLRKSLNLYLQEEDFQKKITHDKLVCLLKDVEEKFYEKKKIIYQNCISQEVTIVHLESYVS